jgi:hypothetical protein
MDIVRKVVVKVVLGAIWAAGTFVVVYFAAVPIVYAMFGPVGDSADGAEFFRVWMSAGFAALAGVVMPFAKFGEPEVDQTDSSATTSAR